MTNRECLVDDERIEYKEKGKLDTKFYDEKGIESIIAMHRYAVENRFDGDEYTTIPIMYKLKNGRTLIRKYKYNFMRDMDVLKPVYESKPKIRLKKKSFWFFSRFKKSK